MDKLSSLLKKKNEVIISVSLTKQMSTISQFLHNSAHDHPVTGLHKYEMNNASRMRRRQVVFTSHFKKDSLGRGTHRFTAIQ